MPKLRILNQTIFQINLPKSRSSNNSSGRQTKINQFALLHVLFYPTQTTTSFVAILVLFNSIKGMPCKKKRKKAEEIKKTRFHFVWTWLSWINPDLGLRIVEEKRRMKRRLHILYLIYVLGVSRFPFQLEPLDTFGIFLPTDLLLSSFVFWMLL